MIYIASGDLEQDIIRLATNTVLIASLALLATTAVAILLNKKAKKKTFKKYSLPLFLIMTIAMAGSTLVLFGSTIYLNTVAESKGPVHWHTDIEFWACNAELELRDPHGFLSNKIGTATYHEHNDKRIHLEGVVVKKSYDASLEKFMQVTGGYITSDSLGFPLNSDPSKYTATPNHQDGDIHLPSSFTQLERHIVHGDKGPVLALRNGEASCDGEPAELQAFLIRYNKEDETYTQTKLESPKDYVMRDESVVPPGDCVIVEFSPRKDRTNRLCQQYGVRDSRRCVEFGVKEYNPDLCNIREVVESGGAQ